MRMATPLLSLITALTSVQALSQAGGQQEQLSVTATVVRPAVIAVLPSSSEETILLIHHTDAIEVEAVGGTVSQTDQDSTTVTSNGAGLLTLTLIY